MIEKIISGYMATNRRLVVPTLGAFLRKDDNSTLVFVEFLKKDDGVLISLVAAELGLNESDAREVIEQYVLRAKQQLSQKGEFIMDGLGVMRVDANNLYHFDYNISAHAIGAKPVQQASAPSSRPIVPRETPVVRDSVPASSTVSASPQVRHSSPSVNATQSAVQQSPTQSAVAPQVQTWPATQPQPEHSPRTIVSQPQSQPQPRPEPIVSSDVKGLRYQKPMVSPYAGRSKKRADTIMIIAIVAALIAIGAMLYGIFADTGQELKLKPTPEVQSEQPIETPAENPTK